MNQSFKPFLGRIIVEIIEGDYEQYMKEQYGVDKDSKIVLPNIKELRVPIKQGKIVKISKNSFGERFEKWYGKDIANEGKALKEGDIVSFIENQTYGIDFEGKYHIISDEHIMGYITKEEAEAQSNDRQRTTVTG